MRDMQLLEARRLCADTTGVDPTFGKNGVPLPTEKYIADSILATHGAVFVSARDRVRQRVVVFKYDERGVLDTKWGLGGYVVPKVYSQPVADLFYGPFTTLAYDARTKGLLVGYGDFNRVVVERHTADGAVDTAWGTGGYFSHYERKKLFTLNAIVPLVGKKILVATRRQELEGVYSQVTRPDADPPGQLLQALPLGRDDVTLMRADRLGRPDRTFNGGSPLVVAGGNLSRDTDAVVKQHTVIKGRVFSDTPSYRDLQLRDDGSVRVITTRVKCYTIRSQANEGTANAELMESTKAGVAVTTTVVSAKGRLVQPQSRTYILKEYRTYDSAGARPPYAPVAAFAAGQDGIALLLNTSDGSPLLRLTPPFGRTSTDLFTPNIEHEYAIPSIDRVRRGGNGDVIVESDQGSSVKLTGDLTSAVPFNGGLISSISAIDDSGRVLADYGDRVARFV